MTPHDEILNQLMGDQGRFVRINTGLYSLRLGDSSFDPYGKEAVIYDALIGNPLYNRLIWGNWPRDYADFAHEAIKSGTGPLLDAAGGTLVFTADTFLQASRPVVVVDQSIGMLRRAQARLIRKNGRMPEHVILVQGDLLALPFRKSSFSTVLSLGLLHLFEDSKPLLNSLNEYLTGSGRLFMTSLVAETKLGSAYLKLLQKSGKVANPRSAAELKQMLVAFLARDFRFYTKKNMAYIQAGEPTVLKCEPGQSQTRAATSNLT